MKKFFTILCLFLLVSCSPEERVFDTYNHFLMIDGVLYIQEDPQKGMNREPVNGIVITRSDLDGKTGRIEKEIKYINGIKNGPYVEYYYNGQIEKKGQFKDGKENGYFEKFFEHGQLNISGTYINGEFIGPVEYFDGSGDLYLTEIHDRVRDDLYLTLRVWENGEEPVCLDNGYITELWYLCEFFLVEQSPIQRSTPPSPNKEPSD